ncbi:MAG: tetratricopeptide repeat protein [Spirochaetales bacterium]|nr:tetratricopeptide repeat protein [Spirochaetales bacterium]
MSDTELKKDIDEYLNDVYRSTARRELDKALNLLDEAYAVDFDRAELSVLLRMLKFWKERWNRMTDFTSLYEKGDYLLGQWDHFTDWSAKSGYTEPEQGIQSLKYMVHSEALNCYEQLHLDDSDDLELHLGIGRCNKVLGNYEKAVSILEKGVRINRENPRILAELADTYALVDEVQGAKIFFREAFYLDPSQVELSKLESGLIKRLIEKVTDTGIENEYLCEWLPVYGVIYGVFNVKREMRPIEYGKLKQSIFSLQNEIRQDSENGKLVPRLINRYFWLIDHYISTKEDRKTIDEVLMNIRLLSPSIYRQYIN